MSYRVYAGPAGAEELSPLEKTPGLYKEFPRFDDALAFARHLNDGKRVALAIEGDDGTRMNRREIAAALRHSEQEVPERRLG